MPPARTAIPPTSPRREGHPYDTERLLRALKRLRGGKPFRDVEDAQACLADFQGRRVDDICAEAGMDATEQAQELAFQALEAATSAQSLAKARAALALDPACLDAQIVLIQQEAPQAQEAVRRLKELKHHADALSDADVMKTFRGQLWGILEARPHLRLRVALAAALEEAGKPKEALLLLEELLQLDKEDWLQARWRLAKLYLRLNRLKPLQALLKTYAKDQSAAMLWITALERFRSAERAAVERTTKAAAKALQQAMDANAHMADLLTGRALPPRKTPPGPPTPGSLAEGVQLFKDLGPTWTADHAAMFWLFQMTSKREG